MAEMETQTTTLALAAVKRKLHIGRSPNAPGPIRLPSSRDTEPHLEVITYLQLKSARTGWKAQNKLAHELEGTLS